MLTRTRTGFPEPVLVAPEVLHDLDAAGVPPVAVGNRLTAEQLAARLWGDSVTIECAGEFRDSAPPPLSTGWGGAERSMG